MGRLHHLVRWSMHEEAKAEIENGADVNALVKSLTPLEIAIGNGDVAMVDILIRAGADVNHGHPKSGRRPLDCAVSQSDLRILKLLLQAGADVEGCPESGTPLCTAAAFGKREAYDLLLAAGANPMATMHGKTAAETLESKDGPDQWISQLDAKREEPDRFADHIKKMMEEHPNVEEYAAHYGRNIYVYGIDQGVFTDSEVGKWARELGEIIRSPELLKQCEERFLTGDELQAARREHLKLEQWQANERAREERIARAAQAIVMPSPAP